MQLNYQESDEVKFITIAGKHDKERVLWEHECLLGP